MCSTVVSKMGKRPVVKTSHNSAGKLTKKAMQDLNHGMHKASQIIIMLGRNEQHY